MVHRYSCICYIVNTLKSVMRPGFFANGGIFQLPLQALKVLGLEGVMGLCASKASSLAEFGSSCGLGLISGLFTKQDGCCLFIVQVE